MERLDSHQTGTGTTTKLVRGGDWTVTKLGRGQTVTKLVWERLNMYTTSVEPT